MLSKRNNYNSYVNNQGYLYEWYDDYNAKLDYSNLTVSLTPMGRQLDKYSQGIEVYLRVTQNSNTLKIQPLSATANVKYNYNPKTGDYTQDFGVYNLRAIMDYMMKNIIVWIKFEIDSSYSADSIRGNFDRLTTSTKNNVWSFNNPVNKKVPEYIYSLKIDSNPVNIIYDVYPYKNGSKVVCYFQLLSTVIPENNIIRFDQMCEEVKKEIIKIVNS